MNDEIEPFDGDEIELVSDGDGLAVLGSLERSNGSSTPWGSRRSPSSVRASR